MADKWILFCLLVTNAIAHIACVNYENEKTFQKVVDERLTNLEKAVVTLVEENMHLKKKIKDIEGQHTTTRKRHAIPDIAIGSKSARQTAENGPTAFTSCVGIGDLTNLGAHQTIIFDRIITNYGQAYRNSTGIFHAPISGVYAFHLSAMSLPNHSLYLNFVHDGVIIDGIYSTAHGITEVESVGEMWTLEMKQGSEVWIASSGQGEIHGNCHTMFSGFLLFETEPTNIIG